MTLTFRYFLISIFCSLKAIIKSHTAKHYIEQSRCTICELIDFGRAIDKESYEDNQVIIYLKLFTE